MYNNNFPLGLINNPIIHSVYVQGNNEGGFNPTPPSSVMLYEDGETMSFEDGTDMEFEG